MRFDFVFSYWIFAWYLLYELGVIRYNPGPAIIAGLLENAILLYLMFYWQNRWIHIFSFTFINLCIKVIPLWTLRNTGFEWSDIYATIVLFGIYVLWVFLHGKITRNIISEQYRKIQMDKPVGPFMDLVDKI